MYIGKDRKIRKTVDKINCAQEMKKRKEEICKLSTYHSFFPMK